MTKEQQIGVLILHTGSPEAPEPEALQAYLKRFLMDPYVLAMPGWVRWPLVNWVIAPLRASKSAAKYRAIWMAEGSPLPVLTQRFASALQERLPTHRIAVGAAYASPTVAEALRGLVCAGARNVIVLPMFAQFAGATRGSLQAAVDKAVRALAGDAPTMVTLPPFYDAPEYLEAMRQLAAPMLAEFNPDTVVFSYHGLPLRQAHETPSDGSVLSYETQCLRSTEVLVTTLALEPKRCRQAYQSRFGRGWLGPTLEEVLRQLAAQGCRRVAVLAPSFVTDCLETLEELDIGAKTLFLDTGGEAFLRIPALNDHPAWVDAAVKLLARR